MNQRKAEILEKSLQQAAQGKSIDEEMAPLVETAQLVSALAEPPPAPPNRLIRGRQQFLTEASRLRMQQTAKPKLFVWRAGNMRLKLASGLIAALLVFGMVFGVGQAAAASLPGGPLYGLKLTVEEARMGLTSDPAAKAELATEFAENRLDEIGKMMSAGKAVDGETAHKAQQQLSQAYQYAHQVNGEKQLQARHRLADVIENQHRFMALEVNGMAEQQQEPVRTLLRSMVQVRTRVNEGQGEQNRQELGDPGDPQPPNPADQPGSGPHAGQAGQDDGLLDASGETGQGGQGQGQGAMGPVEGDSPGQGQAGQKNGNEVDPNQNDDAQWGPGSELQDGPQGPYEGDGPSYGPGPDEPTQGSDAKFQWLWRLFQKEPKSGSSSSGNGSSGSGSSGRQP